MAEFSKREARVMGLKKEVDNGVRVRSRDNGYQKF